MNCDHDLVILASHIGTNDMCLWQWFYHFLPVASGPQRLLNTLGHDDRQRGLNIYLYHKFFVISDENQIKS